MNEQFIDEVYENMDDISKLIEPFEYEVNNELSLFPDEIEIPVDILFDTASTQSGWYFESFSTTVSSIVSRIARSLNLEKIVYETTSSSSFTVKMFELVQILDDEENGSLVFDTVTRTLTGGKLVLRKKAVIVEDSDIEKRMITSLVQGFRYQFISAASVNKSRLNEVADMFGAKDAKKERGWNPKVNCLMKHYESMIKDKRLNIKDFELFKRFVKWNVSYIKDGNLPSLANLTRLKIMLRQGLPIYSIKEEQI